MTRLEKTKMKLIFVMSIILLAIVILYSVLGWDTDALLQIVGGIVTMIMGYFGVTSNLGKSILEKGLARLEKRKTQTRDDAERSPEDLKRDEESL